MRYPKDGIARSTEHKMDNSEPDPEITGYGEWHVDEDMERDGYVSLTFTEIGPEGVETMGVTVPAPTAVQLGEALCRVGEALIDGGGRGR